MEYKVVYAEGFSADGVAESLNRKVEKSIKEGFRPIGSVQVVAFNGYRELYQAMVKEEQ